MTEIEIKVATPVDSTIDDSPEGETLSAVLANRAHGRSISELRTTALGCALNAGLLFVYHPKLSWLAWAFVAASSFGIWGLADRVASNPKHDAPSRLGAQLVRAATVSVGAGAAMWAVLQLMRVVLGPGLWH